MTVFHWQARLPDGHRYTEQFHVLTEGSDHPVRPLRSSIPPFLLS